MQTYCLKCHEYREMMDPQEVVMKNGVPAIKGTCALCGTKMNKIVSKKSREENS